ncbi:MAG: nascent polypeptide-associated complex protein, partial [Candidatus Anstonellales archaeon]
MAMLKQAGIKVDSIDAVEVIIKTTKHEIKIETPSVIEMEQAGKKTFVVEGKVIKEEKEKHEAGEERQEMQEVYKINAADVDFVSKQANVSKEIAEQALKKAKGDIAKAIMIINKEA